MRCLPSTHLPPPASDPIPPNMNTWLLHEQHKSGNELDMMSPTLASSSSTNSDSDQESGKGGAFRKGGNRSHKE